MSVKINRVVGLLLKEGARAGNIAKILTELNDRLVRKVLEIAEKKFGPPPLPYCWIAFGSEGRKEQTFKTDQDNAIIYGDPSTRRRKKRRQPTLPSFPRLFRKTLSAAVSRRVPADYMARNIKWRQPLRTWKKYFSAWVAEPTPERNSAFTDLF